MTEEITDLLTDLKSHLPLMKQSELMSMVRVRLAGTLAAGAYILAMWPDLTDEARLSYLDQLQGQLTTQVTMVKGRGMYESGGGESSGEDRPDGE